MKKLLILICIASQLPLIAQKKKEKGTSNLLFQPNRVEFEIGKVDEDFTIINGGYDGVAVVQQTFNKIDGKYAWHITKLDSALEEQWKKTLFIDITGRLIGYEYFGGKYYLLLTASQYRTQDLLVYEIDEQANVNEFEITTVFPIRLEYFEVIGETIILGGNVNSKPAIITYSVKEKKPKVLPGFYENRNAIMDIIVDDDELMFTVILREKLISRQYTIRAKTFTSEGLMVQDLFITAGDKKNLIDGASTTFDNGIQLVAGAQSKRSTSYSKGLYLAKFVNGRQQFIKYHNYADLENFFGYLNDKREQRIKERIKRRKDLGKNSKFNYRLLVHDMIEVEDGVNLMVAEAYYPRYSSSGNFSSPYSYGYGGRGVPTTFMGYKFTHAIVVAFNNNGDILWDHSFKIKDVQTYSLDKLVSVGNFGEETVLMYLDENEIRSKIVRQNEVVEGKTYNPVRLNDQLEEVRNRNPDEEGIDHWFQECFYAYGVQNLGKPGALGFKNVRKVFYINKIKYNGDGVVN